MNTLTAQQQRVGMSLTVEFASHLEVTHKHQFGDGQFNKVKDYPGPKRGHCGAAGR